MGRNKLIPPASYQSTKIPLLFIALEKKIGSVIYIFFAYITNYINLNI